MAKRAFDVGGALVGLLASAPILGVACAAIWMEDGAPTFHRQSRLGKDGKVFELWKLRTMRKGAAVRLGADGAVACEESDARLTRIGAVLRRTSLDELPQLWNVLRGDMSIVGPRPDLPEAERFYTPTDRERLKVKPGITGLAQVSGRNRLSPQEKWALDVEYVRRRSLFLDAQILLRTVLTILKAEGIFRTKTER